MPLGKTYNRHEGKWVDEEKERRIDYNDMTDEEAEAAALLIAYWRWYPDKFMDICESETPDFQLAIIQRIMLRAFCRYEEVFITGGRGVTKTFTLESSRLVEGALWPGIQMQYHGPTVKQTAEIASATWKAIQKNYPILGKLWNVISDANERFELRTRTNSSLTITTVRGTNAHSVAAEEVAQSESGLAFDHEKFRGVVLPAVRLVKRVNKKADPNFPNFQKLYITSAGRQQNESFAYRKEAQKRMGNRESAFILDVPGDVAVLSGIRDISWYEDMKRKLTPEEWLREMKAVWTGTSENPVIRESTLTESKTVQVMEDRHCGDPSVMYIIGYDVSYADGAVNAKCATAVLKCERQTELIKRDKFKKSLVYVFDNPPPRDNIEQAKRLKEVWSHYVLDGGEATYIAIDAQAYGTAVIEALHQDLDDGLPPLCCIEHEFIELEKENALPVIYPIKATSGYVGRHDPDPEMTRYCEVEWEHRNVGILVTEIMDGVEAYKKFNKIKTDEANPTIALPYIKTKELCAQISNLKKIISGTTVKEKRISKAIQRDMWSAVKYAMRVAQIMEKKMLVDANRRRSQWEEYFRRPIPRTRVNRGGRGIGRVGGNRHGW